MNMKRALRVCGLAAGLAMAGIVPVRALSIDTFNEWKYNEESVEATMFDFLKIHLHGIYEGLDWANVVNEEEGIARWFCPPGDLLVEDELIIGMIETELQNPSLGGLEAYPSDIPVELILLHAVRNVFPC
ncbi:MAG: hypothetical protein IH999_11605 [Proteobacteria bacterium]|nr:hypothetical protein [Pseudomonadota bacterium]